MKKYKFMTKKNFMKRYKFIRNKNSKKFIFTRNTKSMKK